MVTARDVKRGFLQMRQTGLSLVEMMVGLTIGLILTLGLFTMISSQSTAFKIQDDFARIQENGTLALRYLGDSIRMAGFYGYWGGGDPTSGITTGTVATANDCGSDPTNTPLTNWALSLGTMVYGFDALTPATVNGVLPCITGGSHFSATPNPIMITRSAAGVRVSISEVTAANNANTIYLQSDRYGGLLFTGGSFAGLQAAGNTRSTAAGGVVDIFEYRTHVYYIRTCSRPSTGSTCTGANDDGGQPIPTLVRQELVGNAMAEIPLVEGIERISYQYGIDDQQNPSDGVPDRFTFAPTAAEWPNVVAVKVSILVRSPTLIAGYNDGGKSYDLIGDGSAPFTCAGVNCAHKRKVFSQTFQMRNIAQRRGA